MEQQELIDKYTKLLVRGNGMVHLPNSNVKLILPNSVIDMMLLNVVIVESLPDQQDAIVPLDGQLNVSYFTGEKSK